MRRRRRLVCSRRSRVERLLPRWWGKLCRRYPQQVLAALIAVEEAEHAAARRGGAA